MDAVEAAARRRAIYGVEKYVLNMGKVVSDKDRFINGDSVTPCQTPAFCPSTPISS